MAEQVRNVDRGSETLGEELRRAVGRFVRAVRAESGTPHSARSEALALLESHGAMNIVGLAQLRNVKHQTMRLIIGQLEADGLVHRASDPTDGRSRIFSITAAGRAALVRERQMRASKIDSLLCTHVSEDERAQLWRAITLLDRISIASES